MNRLSSEGRTNILRQLVEGVSLRSVTRIADCSINTATKLLVDAGKACAAYHDEHLRDLRLTRRIQVDGRSGRAAGRMGLLVSQHSDGGDDGTDSGGADSSSGGAESG